MIVETSLTRETVTWTNVWCSRHHVNMIVLTRESGMYSCTQHVTSGYLLLCINIEPVIIFRYECVCRQGYEVNPQDASLCRDINECESKEKPCSQFCRNTKGSYVCSCDKDYALRADGKSCKANSSKFQQFMFLASTVYLCNKVFPWEGNKSWVLSISFRTSKYWPWND
jgi:hypothetical protein